MKIIKRYIQFINEGVITPSGDKIDRIKSIIEEGEWSTIEELNALLSPDVRFMDVNEFRDSLETDVEKEGVPTNFPLFAAFHTKLKIPVVLYNIPENAIIAEIRGRGLTHILKMIDHEMVHQEQDSRSGGKAYSLESSPAYDTKKYFSHYSEIMAYARTLSKEMFDAGITPEKVAAMARSGKISHWIWNMYKGIGGEAFMRFKRYFYQYIKEHYV